MRYQNEALVISHPLFEKLIGITDRGTGPLSIKALYDEDGRNLLDTNNETPLFEFVIEGQKVTALDPVWRYVRHKTRVMGNGGTEVQLVIEGRRKPVSGLQVVLYQQFFPDATLMREKLVLLSQEGKTFQLNKLGDQLHFVFPQYAIASSVPARSTEIRIASWAAEIVDVDPNAAPDERFEDGRFDDHNLAMNHMYHPKILEYALADSEVVLTKGFINRSGLPWHFRHDRFQVAFSSRERNMDEDQPFAFRVRIEVIKLGVRDFENGAERLP